MAWMILRSRDNNAMHAKSGLRVVLEWKIYRPDSVIADVIPLKTCFNDLVFPWYWFWPYLVAKNSELNQ